MDLRLPQLTVATATVLFHKFFNVHDMRTYDSYVVGMTCLFLAGKIEETPKKLAEVIEVGHKKKSSGESGNGQTLENAQQAAYKEKVLDYEREILQTIEFQLSIEHPYKYVLIYVKTLEGTRDLAQNAWNIVNDSLRTTLCLHHLPQKIAAASIYLSCKALLELGGDLAKGVKANWWDILYADGVRMEEIGSICSTILDIYAAIPNGQDNVLAKLCAKKEACLAPPKLVGPAPPSPAAPPPPGGTPTAVGHSGGVHKSVEKQDVTSSPSVVISPLLKSPASRPLPVPSRTPTSPSKSAILPASKLPPAKSNGSASEPASRESSTSPRMQSSTSRPPLPTNSHGGRNIDQTSGRPSLTSGASVTPSQNSSKPRLPTPQSRGPPVPRPKSLLPAPSPRSPSKPLLSHPKEHGGVGDRDGSRRNSSEPRNNTGSSYSSASYGGSSAIKKNSSHFNNQNSSGSGSGGYGGSQSSSYGGKDGGYKQRGGGTGENAFMLGSECAQLHFLGVCARCL